MRLLPLLTASVLLLLSATARADWIDPKAAYRCDTNAQSFTIASVMDTSSPEDLGTVVAPAGFLEVSSVRPIRCSLRRAKITARFGIRSPQATGICGGITQITLHSLRVNGKAVFEMPILFNHHCLNDESIYSIDFSGTQVKTRIQVCHAKWDWGVGYHGVRCDAREL